MRWGRVALIAIPLLALAALLVLAGRSREADGVSIPLPAPAAGAEGPLPPITPARGENPPLVVIDAGHGGRDPGASSALGGEPESRVTLALAVAMRDALVATGRVRVALTRSDDTYIALEDRYAIARRLGADLFVSVHADIAPANDQARGATVYTLSEVASDREAAALAERENEANRLGPARMSADPNVNLILIDLAQRESMERAAEFARLLHREAEPLVPFRPVWHRFAAFIVLKAPDIPSILFEAGYLSNLQDAADLQSPAGRQRIAEGMRRAIEAHFARRFLTRGG
ncbi:N-acetylmuramoyl-L-alanine amidase family protein [Sphingosinicella sp.]|uniref:N-acetylmuramoyl-L-alanine amidase family protein n=1 Tax=Sphingosinicella sp. TaxID=1917971 RepID=UPI004037EC2B